MELSMGPDQFLILWLPGHQDFALAIKPLPQVADIIFPGSNSIKFLRAGPGRISKQPKLPVRVGLKGQVKVHIPLLAQLAIKPGQ